MKTKKLQSLGLVILAAITSMVTASNIRSEDGDGILVQKPWSRASIMKARPSVAYLTIVNRGQRLDRLLAASSPIAGKVIIHESTMSNGIMSMRHRNSLTIHSGKSVVLKPGGLHLMLSQLTKPLREGDRFELKLRFQRAGTITICVPVLAISAQRAE